MSSKVKYTKEQREKAKADIVRLYTVSITSPGGSEEIIYQGCCNDEFAKKLHELMSVKYKNEGCLNEQAP